MSINDFINKKIFENELSGEHDRQLYSVLLNLFFMGYEHEFVTHFFNSIQYESDNSDFIYDILHKSKITKLVIARVYPSGMQIEGDLSDGKRLYVRYKFNNPKYDEFIKLYFSMTRGIDKRILKAVLNQLISDYECELPETLTIGWFSEAHSIKDIMGWGE